MSSNPRKTRTIGVGESPIWPNYNTLPETNIAPENRPLEKDNSYWKPPFLGAMLVLGSVFHQHGFP